MKITAEALRSQRVTFLLFSGERGRKAITTDLLIYVALSGQQAL
jgi:hypothetical protein